MTRRRPHRTREGVTVAAVLAATMTLAACGSTTSSTSAGGGSSSGNAAPTDGKLTVGLLGDIGQPPDPDIYYANNGLAIVLNVYDGLVQYKNNVDTVTIAPRLATSWKVSSDKRVYTFNLRKGVTFHDGTPFTSAAIKPSFDRRIAVKGGAAYMVDVVKSVATPTPYTAIVTLKKPNAAFLDYLASPFGPKVESPTAMKAHAGKDNAQTYLQSHDIGSGPYELTTAQSGTKYGLTQYAKYWGAKSPFTKVALPIYQDASALQLAFDAGDVHAIVAALPSTSLKKYESSSAVSSYLLPTLQGALVTLNPSNGFFKGRPARRAFMQFLDRKKLIPQVLGDRSELATTNYAPGMLPGGLDVQDITYDPSVLTKYSAGLPAGTKMTVGYATGNPNAQKIAEIVVAKLQAIKIDATAQGYPTAQVFDWPKDPTKGPDAFVDGNNGPDGGSPYMWGHVFWDKTGGINYFLCDDPRVNGLLNKAVTTGDNAMFAKAGKLYSATGCYLNFAHNLDWVVAQKWMTGVPESHNIGANELDFSLLGIAK